MADVRITTVVPDDQIIGDAPIKIIRMVVSLGGPAGPQAEASVTSVFTRAGDVVAESGDYAEFYDPAGAADTAEANAKSYADTSISTAIDTEVTRADGAYDPAGAASTAQATAISAAATDATTKANAAQSAAEAASDPAGSAATAQAAAIAAAATDAANKVAVEAARAVAAEANKADLVSGKVPRSELPNITSVFTVSVANQAAMLALATPDPDTSIQAIRTDVPGTVFWLNPGLSPATLGNWIADPSDPTGAASAAQAAAQAFATSAIATQHATDLATFDASGAASTAQAAAIAAAATDATTKVASETALRISGDAAVEADLAKFAGGWGTAKVNPVTGCYHPSNYGPAGVDPATWTTAQTGAAVRAARDDAVAHIDSTNGYGQTLYLDRSYTVDHDPTITDPFTSGNYCALKTWDYLTIRGAGPATPLILGNNENCHVIAHPGREKAGTSDAIVNFTLESVTVDGNRTNQDGTHKHDGVHIPQHPGYRSSGCRFKNCDGKGLMSSAQGDFGTPGVNIVRPVMVTDTRAENNAQWGFYFYATNRDTSYKGLWSTGNGSPQARIAGQMVCQTIGTAGNFKVSIDASGPFTAALSIGDTPATIVTKINTAIGTHGTAALTTSGVLMITSATTGGGSRVYVQGTSDAWILTSLGIVAASVTDDGNYKVGANEYGGFRLDHSECVSDGLFADSNYGDGFYIHNVDRCHYGTLHATQNKGVGIYSDAFCNSTGFSWMASMNCQDLGYASYRTLGDSAEIYFDNGVEGYGLTHNTSIFGIVAPGDKANGGGLADNRIANWSVYVADTITLTVGNDTPNPAGLHLSTINPGDGGLTGVLRPPTGYVASALSATLASLATATPWAASTVYTAGQFVTLPTGGRAFRTASGTSLTTWALEQAANIWTYVAGGHYVKMNASGNLLAPAGITQMRVRMLGAGGGAGGGASPIVTTGVAGCNGGGGGGAGQLLTVELTGLTSGTNYVYTQGAGGAGGAGAASGSAAGTTGSFGGDSTLVVGATTYTAKGGGQGTGGAANTAANSITGGLYAYPGGVNNAQFTVPGSGGTNGFPTVWLDTVCGGPGGGSSSASQGGGGGQAATGAIGAQVPTPITGGSGSVNGAAGVTATVPGCGGGGGGAGSRLSPGGAGGAGGAGAPGQLEAWF